MQRNVTCEIGILVVRIDYVIISADHRYEMNAYLQVETIGDAYMIVSGVPEVCVDHACNVADFSLAMVAAARQVLSPATGKPLQVIILRW